MWCEDNGARWTEKVNQVRFDKRINHIFSKKDTMQDIDRKVHREDDLIRYNICADKVQVSKKVRAFDIEGLTRTGESRWFLPIGTTS